MRFPSVARGALRALNKCHFYIQRGLLHQQDVMPIFNLLLPTWRYAAPVNVSAMGTAVKKKKCLQSQSVIQCVPISYSTNSESLRRKVHLDCDRMYRADCKWLLDRLYMCGHTSHRLRSSNILRIAPIRYGANKISLPLPNFVSRPAPSAVHYYLPLVRKEKNA